MMPFLQRINMPKIEKLMLKILLQKFLRLSFVLQIISKKKVRLQEKYSDEITLFREIGNKNISCIITTNYDLFLENNFGKDHFQPYIGQNHIVG